VRSEFGLGLLVFLLLKRRQEIHELGREVFVHPSFDEEAGLALKSVLQALVVLRGVHQLLAVYQGAIVGRQKFRNARDLVEVGPVAIVQTLNDAVSEAALNSLLSLDCPIEHQNLVSSSEAELLGKEHGGAALGRLARLHERCSELSFR